MFSDFVANIAFYSNTQYMYIKTILILYYWQFYFTFLLNQPIGLCLNHVQPKHIQPKTNPNKRIKTLIIKK